MSEDDDLQSLRPVAKVKAAAVGLGAAGFFTCLLGLRTNTMLKGDGAWGLIAPVMFLLGGTMLVSAVQTAKMRGWAGKVGLLTSALMSVLAIAWFIFTIVSAVISPMALLVIPICVTAATLAFSVRDDLSKADAARDRLQGAGLDSGM